MHSSQLAPVRPPARPSRLARWARPARWAPLARPGALALAGAAVLTAALTGAAYGSGFAPHRPAGPPALSGPPHSVPVIWTSDQPGTRLDVAYDDGAGHTRSYRLSCAQAPQDGTEQQGTESGGEHGTNGSTDTGTDAVTDPSVACAHLATIGGPVPAVRSGQMCSMIYGGPQTARVTGFWQGRAVRESYRRTNGCEVARWNRMVPALPNPVADASRHGAAPVRS